MLLNLDAEKFQPARLICAALLLIFAFNFAQAYLVTKSYIEITVIDKDIDGAKWIKYAPPIRNDVEELRNFIAAMNKLTAGEKKFTFYQVAHFTITQALNKQICLIPLTRYLTL